MSDKRYFAKIDVGYLDNPKVGSLVDNHKGAVLLHLRAILYCRQHLTDGVFPIAQVARLAATTYCGTCTEQCKLHSSEQCSLQCTGQCMQVCDWCAAVHSGLLKRADDRFGVVHDYLEHQESSRKVADRSAARQKAANVRWDAQRSAEPDAPLDAGCIAGSNATAMQRRGEERRGEIKTGRSAQRRTSPPAADTTPGDADAPPRPDIEALCDRLADRIEANGSRRPNITKAWRTATRLLLDNDHRTPADVERIIDWSQQDTFWRSNVLSMSKLRDKFDTLRLQAERDQPSPAEDPWAQYPRFDAIPPPPPDPPGYRGFGDSPDAPQEGP